MKPSGLEILLLSTIIVATGMVVSADAQTVPPDFTVTTIASGLNVPVALAFAPDGRLFYTEKNTGHVRILNNGNLLPLPFVDVPVNTASERGLLGIAFDPNFSSNGYVYAYYTRSSTGVDTGNSSAVTDNRVVRFTADGDVAQPGSEALIISLPGLPGPNHDGGNIRFGPDGKLYVTIGELAVSSNSLDLSVLPGKILRLNTDGSAPSDNPFANDGDPNTLAEIFAYGLRNSFDFTFHPLTGKLFATENGPTNHDEVNVIEAGQDYGWSQVQGIADTPAELAYKAANPDYRDPILDIAPGTTAPTGIDFSAANDLYFGEFNTGKIRKITLTGGALDQLLSVEDFGDGFGSITDVQIAPDNTLFVATTNAIYRIQGDTALPVELTTFSGRVTQDGVLLQWQTRSETNNLGFSVYRSTAKGRNYGRITPTLISGHGTDSTPHNYSFLDETAEAGQTYWYLIEDVDLAGVTERSDPIQVVYSHEAALLEAFPTEFALYQNYPNSFNPETWIPYALVQQADVEITIYNAAGQWIRTLEVGTQPAGSYLTKGKAAHWDGRSHSGEFVSNGIYFYHLRAGHYSATKKMTVAK